MKRVNPNNFKFSNMKIAINFLICFLFLAFFSSVALAAWNPPTATPPGGTVYPPVWAQPANPQTSQSGNINISGNIKVNGSYYQGGNQGLTLASSCGASQVLKGVDVKGGIITNGTCQADQDTVNTGTVTSVNTGAGLSGGPITVSGTITLNTTDISSCIGANQKILWSNANNRLVCGNDLTGGGGSGTVTSITAGDGLSGGTITGTGTIALSTPVSTSRGGTGADLSSLGGAGQYVKKLTSGPGSSFSVGSIVLGDIPDLASRYIQNQSSPQQTANFNISGDGLIGGKLGIGTTAPTAKLEINEGGIRSGVFTSGTDSFIGTLTNNPLKFVTGTSTANTVRVGMMITNDPSGAYLKSQVGIGANPSAANARLVVCRTGTPSNLCTISSQTVASVVALGSSDDTTAGYSIIAQGGIWTAGHLWTHAVHIPGNGQDIGEYVEITGDASSYEQGDVLSIASSYKKFQKSERAYNEKVAGVVTTTAGIVAGEDEPGTKEPKNSHRLVMALVGQVPVKASNENGAIEPGDLLTTSSLPGYVMKCPTKTSEEKLKCLGAVVGKALEPLNQEKGKIFILLTLK
jgi:hypothetical protein